MTYLENNHILYDLQHGFRKSRSCESQLLQLIQELAKNNNKNIQTDLIIMDLFLIYINDFPEYLLHSKLRLLADDSIIYRDIKTQDNCIKLQQDLDSAARWEADWLMAFHPDKCTKLTVAPKKNNPI